MFRTKAELRRFIINNFLYGRDCGFRDEDSFMEMGIIDSTGLLELVSFVEKHYEIVIEEADLTAENLDSIERLSEFVERKLDLKKHPVVSAKLSQQTA